MKCPTCGGAKTSIVQVHYANRPHEWQNQPCRTCKGGGEISVEQFNFRIKGDQIASGRRVCRLSQREFSVLSKVDYVKQSQIEDDASQATEDELRMIIEALRKAGMARIAELEKEVAQIKELTQ